LTLREQLSNGWRKNRYRALRFAYEHPTLKEEDEGGLASTAPIIRAGADLHRKITQAQDFDLW
jgi:hypothetical protein